MKNFTPPPAKLTLITRRELAKILTENLKPAPQRVWKFKKRAKK